MNNSVIPQKWSWCGRSKVLNPQDTEESIEYFMPFYTYLNKILTFLSEKSNPVHL